MDVVKPKSKQELLSKQQKIMFSLLGLLIVFSFFAKQSLSSISVKRTEILITTVKQGDLDVTIEGYGTLKSDKQQLLTTLTRATVKEILLKPGAKVSTRANLAEINSHYQSAKLKHTAEKKLIAKGIVSQLTFKESQLNEQQLKYRLEIFSERGEQLFEVHKEAINIQQERIKQQQGRLAIAQKRVDKLTVRAGIDGVLQRLSVELGQSLAAGQEIALIGSVTDLIALIRVPQNQAQQIKIGQRTIIDTRRDKIEGVVARINPIVESNTVNIEVSLPQKLPSSARPQQNVDGVIIVEPLPNINYIKRPANAKAFSQGQVYLLDEDQQTAKLTNISYGSQAGHYIKIRAGASVNDNLIISDLTNLARTAKQITISN